MCVGNSLLSLHLLLVKELAGLLDTGGEETPVLHDAADVLDGQVYDHASETIALTSLT